MTVLLPVFVGVLGVAVGSFLNVVIWRVPRRESIVRPRSRCTGCGTPLSSLDNIPVLSWLILGGKCRTCKARISLRYPLVELGSGALFAATAIHFGFAYYLPAYLVLGASLVALSAIDIEHKLLPNRLVYPTGFAVGFLLFLAALAEGEPERILWALAGGAGSFAMFFVLHLISPNGMAFGDVRLSFVLGIAVGWLSLSFVPLFLFVSFLVSAAFGITYAIVSGKGLKAAIAFGPFLALGAEVAIFAGRPLVNAYLGG